jgi:hypothetical protein
MGKENIWPSNIKWRREDPHHSRVGGSVQRHRYYIRKGRLRWLGHVERILQERIVKKAIKNVPEGKRSVGKPRKRRMVDVENDLKKMGIRGWRKIARGDRDAWKLILKETTGSCMDRTASGEKCYFTIFR